MLWRCDLISAILRVTGISMARKIFRFDDGVRGPWWPVVSQRSVGDGGARHQGVAETKFALGCSSPPNPPYRLIPSSGPRDCDQKTVAPQNLETSFF